MTSPREVELEQAQDRKARRVLRCLDGGLPASIAYSGGALVGLSVKFGAADVLLTLRANFPSGAMVAFVGGETLPNCILKAAREAGRDGLRWREDKWRT